MYHQVSDSRSRGLTISVEKLEAQFAYLTSNGYVSHHLKDLVGLKKLPKGRHVVITFDDAYVNQLELAYPLLQKYGLKATFFVPLKYVGKTDEWNKPASPLMSAEQLNSLDSEIIELAHHSYAHMKFDKLSPKELIDDMQQAFNEVEDLQLPFSTMLAYPYGKYPKHLAEKQAFKNTLKQQGITWGLRIGNRVNRFPFRNPFEVQRLDIKGQYSLRKFRRKLRYGKVV